jgi:hypothetical protein
MDGWSSKRHSMPNCSWIKFHVSSLLMETDQSIDKAAGIHSAQMSTELHGIIPISLLRPLEDYSVQSLSMVPPMPSSMRIWE